MQSRYLRGLAALLCAGACSSAAVAAATPDAVPAVRTEMLSGPIHDRLACAVPSRAMTARCHAHIIVDDAGKLRTFATPTGYGPSDLRSAYNITAAGNASTVIAIVDAYGYSKAEADLATYRSQFGLPACTSDNGCFRKVDQNGGTAYPADNTGWSQETALDLDMVSAMCPGCSILLVEANTASMADLSAAANTAARLGAHAISNSYGGSDSSATKSYESAYDHPGIAITVSTGDSGYGVQFPASSPHVTAVGGTSLSRSSSSTRGWTEKAWKGAGSGCSKVYGKPSWQTDTGCSMRAIADVSAVADPATGVAVYGPGSSGSAWLVVGGTSASAPLIAGVYGVNGGAVAYGSDPYDHTSALFDVTSGRNGLCLKAYLCKAGTGYDGPTGLGTPNGPGAF